MATATERARPRVKKKALPGRLSGALEPSVWGLPLLVWQVAFLLVPTVLLFLMSFWTVENFRLVADYNVENWKETISGPIFGDVVLRTLQLAGSSAVLVFLLAYPLAYTIAFKLSPTGRRLAIALLIAPFFSAYLIRLYSWNFMLSDQGVINYLLDLIGLGPIKVLGSWWGIQLGYFANFFPLIAIILTLSFMSVDQRLIEAANNLGAGRVRSLLTVVTRSAKVGVLLALTIGFILAFGDPVSGNVLGLERHPTLGDLVSAEKQGGVNFPAAAVVAVVMVAIVLVAVFLVTWLAFPPERQPDEESEAAAAAAAAKSTAEGRRLSVHDAQPARRPWTPAVDWFMERWDRKPERQRWVDRAANVGLRGYMLLCYAVIFLPLGALVLFSFADTRFPTLPLPGLTLEWYTTLTDDPDVIPSFRNSIIVALTVGVVATVLGAMSAYFLNRWSEFRGYNLYLAIVFIGPCIPLVILGLTMFIFLNEVELAGSINAIILAHIGYCAAFSVGIIRMRLLEMDKHIEQAAWNLGANNVTAIFRVVLPMAAPSVIAAFFLTMAVSWNEFVIAWFVSGLDVTLPVKIFNYFAGNVSPRVNAIGTLVLAMSFLLIALAMVFAFLFGRRQQVNLTPEGANLERDV